FPSTNRNPRWHLKEIPLFNSWLDNLGLRQSAMFSGQREQLTDNALLAELVAHHHLVRGSVPSQSDARRLNALLMACRWTKPGCCDAASLESRVCRKGLSLLC